MYQASSAFHQAVANGAPQKALLIFEDAIFSNDDVDVESGIELDDYFNTEEDLAIGQALSNELRFTMFNDDRLLNDYEFGDFTATLGAQISQDTYTENGNVTAYNGLAAWTGHSTTPYLKLNGSAVGSQPGWAVHTIVIYNGRVYVFGNAVGQYKVYTTSGTAVQATIPAAMRKKGVMMNGKGVNINMTARTMDTWQIGVHAQYEFVPLGKFVAKRPNVPDVNQIQFTCHDFMTKFDIDMPTKEEMGLTYPTTFRELFEAMCYRVGVEYATSRFINSEAVLTSEPDEFENVTMREVLQWLAEAAAANLRFNRDGVLLFDWLKSTNTALTEHDYIEYKPYWYETTQVNKLYNRSTDTGTDRTVGDGDNGYLIQNNPLLRGVS